MSEKFWWLLLGACVAWYSTVTVYVALRGALDIRGMLRRLSQRGEETLAEEEIT